MSIVYILSMAAFKLQRQSWVVTTETTWPAKCNIFTIWFFMESFQCLVWMIVQQNVPPLILSSCGQSVPLHMVDVECSHVSYLGRWDVRGRAVDLHYGACFLVILSFQREEHVLSSLLAHGEWRTCRAKADPTPCGTMPSRAHPRPSNPSLSTDSWTSITGCCFKPLNFRVVCQEALLW